MSKIVAIVGPTAAGKTEVAIELSKQLSLEIISADSRQVYKYLNIGTNKPLGKWSNYNGEIVYLYKGIPYHLVDFLEPDQQYDAGKFFNDSTWLIRKISNKGVKPLIVGGTGLYIKTLTDGISLLPARDQKLREHLMNLASSYGKDYLFNMLKQLDPVRASQVHPNNIHRIIRSIEIILKTGKTFTELIKQHPPIKNFDILLIGLYLNKQQLVQRVHLRTKWMLQNGMLEETQELISKGVSEKSPVFSSIGYNWVIKFLKNEISFETMENMIIKDTLAYIKRQITWFKKDNRINWINCDGLTLKQITRNVLNIINSNPQ
ncbi:MAG: tRNA (adenosine(37)-N6)-dimethylallyltransferase MiaA [Endomicrobia bacterium]|nr:tRNA (adenosine(37)-N6)-dimethylallyltransferase MiaA [Endomicrobiia bacterium]